MGGLSKSMAKDGFRARDAARFLAAAIAFVLAMGQQTAAGQASYGSIASFVSRLKAEAVGHQIRLTWKDSPDIVGIYRVYRFTEELTSKNFSKAAMVGQVNSGVEYYMDTPPDTAGYYYAVLVQDTAGTLYPLLIPFRNKTSVAAAVASIASKEQEAARVTGTVAAAPPAGGSATGAATPAGGSATGTAAPTGGSATATATAAAGSSTATPTAAGGSATGTAPPTEGGATATPTAAGGGATVPVTAPPMGGGATATPTAAENTTAGNVQVPVASDQVSLSSPAVDGRGTPLPSLTLDYAETLGLSSVPEVASEKKVSPATERAISHLLLEAPQPTAAKLTAQVLSADATPAPGTELGELLDIIQGPFKRGDMNSAQKSFLSFLSVSRTAEVEAHVRFYLGQTYYLQGNTREALMEFLMSENYFYQYAQPWLDACFADLEKADQ